MRWNVRPNDVDAWIAEPPGGLQDALRARRTHADRKPTDDDRPPRRRRKSSKVIDGQIDIFEALEDVNGNGAG